MKKAFFNWSTGKDSAFALWKMQVDQRFKVDRLVTTVNEGFGRVSMHGIRTELLELQAQALDLETTCITLPESPTMEEYDRIFAASMKTLQAQGYDHCGYGDIFLEDLRQYREDLLRPLSITAHFPLWKLDTQKLIQNFISEGFKAIVINVNAELLDASFVGRELDASFIQDLPDHIDPCGENGEFHTFCYDGPIFNVPVSFTVGEKVQRDYHNAQGEKIGSAWFCDLG